MEATQATHTTHTQGKGEIAVRPKWKAAGCVNDVMWWFATVAMGLKDHKFDDEPEDLAATIEDFNEEFEELGADLSAQDREGIQNHLDSLGVEAETSRLDQCTIESLEDDVDAGRASRDRLHATTRMYVDCVHRTAVSRCTDKQTAAAAGHIANFDGAMDDLEGGTQPGTDPHKRIKMTGTEMGTLAKGQGSKGTTPKDPKKKTTTEKAFALIATCFACMFDFHGDLDEITKGDNEGRGKDETEGYLVTMDSCQALQEALEALATAVRAAKDTFPAAQTLFATAVQIMVMLWEATMTLAHEAAQQDATFEGLRSVINELAMTTFGNRKHQKQKSIGPSHMRMPERSHAWLSDVFTLEQFLNRLCTSFTLENWIMYGMLRKAEVDYIVVDGHQRAILHMQKFFAESNLDGFFSVGAMQSLFGLVETTSGEGVRNAGATLFNNLVKHARKVAAVAHLQAEVDQLAGPEGFSTAEQEARVVQRNQLKQDKTARNTAEKAIAQAIAKLPVLHMAHATFRAYVEDWIDTIADPEQQDAQRDVTVLWNPLRTEANMLFDRDNSPGLVDALASDALTEQNFAMLLAHEFYAPDAPVLPVVPLAALPAPHAIVAEQSMAAATVLGKRPCKEDEEEEEAPTEA